MSTQHFVLNISHPQINAKHIFWGGCVVRCEWMCCTSVHVLINFILRNTFLSIMFWGNDFSRSSTFDKCHLSVYIFCTVFLQIIIPLKLNGFQNENNKNNRALKWHTHSHEKVIQYDSTRRHEMWRVLTNWWMKVWWSLNQSGLFTRITPLPK